MKILYQDDQFELMVDGPLETTIVRNIESKKNLYYNVWFLSWAINMGYMEMVESYMDYIRTLPITERLSRTGFTGSVGNTLYSNTGIYKNILRPPQVKY